VKRLGTEALHDVVQRRQHPQHPVHVLFPEIQLRRFFKGFVPGFVP
jgi:hypothetical protein